MPKRRAHFSGRILTSLARLDVSLSAYSNIATFLLAYGLTNIVLFCFGIAGEYRRWPDDKLRAYAIGIARGFGYDLNFNVAVVAILASKGLLTVLRRTALNAVIPFDKAMPQFHALVGWVTFSNACLHGLFHSIGGFPRGMWEDNAFGGWRYCVCTGIALFLIFICMVVTAYKPMRDANFERFIWVHLVGATVFFVLLTMHGFYLGKFYTYKWIAGPCVIYLLDRLHRKAVENKGTVFIRVNGRACRGNGIVRLEVPKVFRFQAGQYAEVKIPSLSRWQWHPFTISSAPHESSLVFYIKAVGEESSWTRKLHRLFSEDDSFSTVCDAGELEVHVRGPFGAPAQHCTQYDRMILISGGVGGTPFLSIAKHIGKQIEQESKTAEIMMKTGGRDDASSLTESDSEASSDDGMDIIDFNDIGISHAVGGPAAKKRRANRAQTGGKLKKRPTIRQPKDPNSIPAVETGTWGEFALGITYSVCLNTALLWVLLVRMASNLIALAFNASSTSLQGTTLFEPRYILYSDFAVGALLLLVLSTQLLVESHAKVIDVVDILLLLPCFAFQTVVEALSISGLLVSDGDFSAFCFYLFWPATLAAFLLRYFRIMGHRILLVESVVPDNRNVRSLDFVWTSPTEDDDEWLCSDLEASLTHSRAIRLHRFLTREEAPKDEELGASAIPGFKNNYGRPDFSSLFSLLAKNSPNGTTVGVFCCGPVGLTASVKRAALEAMLESRRRGLEISIAGNSDTRCDQSFGDALASFDENEISMYEGALRHMQTTRESEDWRRSFNIRFIVREENF